MPGTPTADRLSASLKDPKSRDKAITEIVTAFRRSGGNATHAAARLDVSHRAIMNWVKKYPGLNEKVRQVREEHGVIHAVGDPNRSKKP